jgi:hypothetical protein
MLCDSTQDPWAELLVLVKGEDEVRAIRVRQSAMRSRLTLDHPADSLQGPQEPGALWWRASCSRRLERNVDELGWRFPVLEAFGNDAER